MAARRRIGFSIWRASGFDEGGFRRRVRWSVVALTLVVPAARSLKRTWPPGTELWRYVVVALPVAVFQFRQSGGGAGAPSGNSPLEPTGDTVPFEFRNVPLP